MEVFSYNFYFIRLNKGDGLSIMLDSQSDISWLIDEIVPG